MDTARQAVARGQKHIDDRAAVVVALIRNIEGQQDKHDSQDSEEQRIAEGRFQLLLQLFPGPEGQDAYGNAKVRGSP